MTTQTETKTETQTEKVAVLGGGLGALTAAWFLSGQKHADGTAKYAVTIHQLGHRLGGKLATGRNEARGYRIEEHGIHGYLGCYYNACGVALEVFEELRSIPGLTGYLTRFEDAFKEQSSAVLWECPDGANWKTWPMRLPTNDAQFADYQVSEDWHMTVVGMLEMILQHMPLVGRIPGASVSESAVRGALKLIEDSPFAEKVAEIVAEVLEGVWKAIRTVVDVSGLDDLSDDIRRAVITIDFACTMLTGFFEDDIPHRGYASIDHEDYTAWLRRHGAAPATLASPMVMNTPAITYNFPLGDMTLGANQAAGTYLQWTLRSFRYVGAFVQAFRAGSGETVLAPMYRALLNRGVKFEFFRKVTALHLSADKSAIASVDMEIQATLAEGVTEYDPLIPVKDLQCWPLHPRYELLAEGEALKAQDIDLESWWTPWQPVGQQTLVAGEDFDHVVLGISLGAFPYICQELIADAGNAPLVEAPAGATRWSAMVDQIETVQTQAMQLWFNDPVTGLLPQDVDVGADNTWISGTYVLPISGQADFSDLLPVEDWPADGPKGLFYLCGTMADSGIPPFSETDFPAQQAMRVKSACIQYLEATAGPMFPQAETGKLPKQGPASIPCSLDFSTLYTPDETERGEKRFDYQFWRANIDPTERYVTCQPGAVRFRLNAWDSGYSNLALAGDWIDTGLNVGSAEGAVMGGKLAAHAISGSPALREVPGYDPFGLRANASDRE